MSDRIRVSSGTTWEAQIGYSRAVRVGDVVEVAGTTAVDETGAVVGPGDPYEQARYIFAKIERALHEAGATMQDVVRTRMFVTDVAFWQAVGRAHGEHFREVRPVATLVEVSALIEPALLVEIEVTAIVSAERANE